MKNSLDHSVNNPCIYTKGNTIYKVSKSFLRLIGYKNKDIIGRSFMDLMILLRCELQISIHDIDQIPYLYIFNSDNLPIQVKVSLYILDNYDNKGYYFEEKTDKTLDFILKNFDNNYTSKNESVAIFSYPDFILLKHNENYAYTLSLMNINYDNIVGQYPLFPNNILDLFKQDIPFHELGVESIDSHGVVTYWDINVKMIYGDNIKYLVASFYDVTERVRDGKYTCINKAGKENLSPYVSEIKALDSKIIYDSFRTSDININKLLLEEIANKEIEKILKVQEEIFINTSHELKTPLNVIFSSSQLLNLFLEKDSLGDAKDPIIYYNKVIIENCYRLNKLINDILDISKLEFGLYELNLSNYNIVDIIDHIVQLVSDYTRPKGVKIIFDTEIEELIIELDIYKFNRVLLNLISNAIKFSNASKVISIRLVEGNNNTMKILIEDKGIGIDEKNLDIIFEKFIQVNKNLNRISEGTGIGLFLVKSIVELHEGNITVESILGKGSTFIIELPIKTIDINNINQVRHNNNNNNTMEMIKYELSDIYLYT